jgi:preprotein translocase subunit SecD
VSSSNATRRALRGMSWLLILTGLLVALIAGGVVWDKQSWVPKLALDLEGGTEIILAPQVQEGVTITEEQLSQAVSIIRQRVDAAGVSESEVSTQGGTNIVVSIPGTPDQETLDRIRSSAKMEFRAVLITEMLASLESVGAVDAEGNPTGLPTAIPDPTASPTDGSDINWVNAALYDQYISATCEELDAAGANVADPTKPLVACSDDGAFKYVLGPVEVDGSSIVDAQANYIVGQNGVQTNEWGVYLTFDAEGTTNFATVTTRLSALTGAQNQFAVVLDGRVIIAPATLAVITDGKPVISGAYTEITSKSLADQLKFGALPIGFEVQSSDTVTPTLGVAQLQSGLIAGAIGLVLVIIYSLIQYRALAAVTIASLIVAFGFTYLVITYLSAANGYRLSLAGVAGLIVAIGVTADSFIVYFERVRDELREGRTLGSAVDAGWTRAVRTIVVSDAVNLLAAVVLFVLAVGNVRGFAFTLGVTTVVDLIVVILFTHPMLQLLSRTRFFASGHPMSGLNPRALGAVYRGRAQFNVSETVTVSERGKSSKEARKRQTIAERRAAEQGDAS